MSVVLLGSTSGSVTLQEPAVAGSTTINLPATSGTMAVLPTATSVLPEASGGTGTTTGYYGFKNRIINGAMVIDQRNAGAEVNPAESGIYYLDRYITQSSVASKFKIGQNAGSVTPPTGFINYLGCTSLSAYTVGASDAFNIQQRIEGLNVADLAWGTASAATVTLSFWVYSSLTGTSSRQTFTAGSAPSAGYEFAYFMRQNITAVSGGSFIVIAGQDIEDVRTFAGQQIIFSFWMKADSARALTNATYGQNFGSGGSGTVESTFTLSTTSLTTSWQRITGTATVPSISGKTIGTGSNFFLYLSLPTAGTFDMWGWQVEAAASASPFQTATGTKQGELAACQRYYWRSSGNGAAVMYGVGISATTTAANICVVNPVTMRVAPTAIDFSTLGIGDAIGYNLAVSALTISHAGITSSYLAATNATGASTARTAFLQNKDSTAGYLGLSAEL